MYVTLSVIHSHLRRYNYCLLEQFALEVANPQPYVFVARSMFTTSTGALQLWQQDAIQWTREESLAEIQSVDFVDLPERKAIEDALDGHNFLTRVLRQIREARVWLCSFIPIHGLFRTHTGLPSLRCWVWPSVPDWLFSCIRRCHYKR